MERLRQRADFLAAAAGQRVAVPAFVVQVRDRRDPGPVRIGFTVSKKVGNAVERNRVRRRLRELVKRSGPLLCGRTAIMCSSAGVRRSDAASIRMLDDLKSALKRLDAQLTKRARSLSGMNRTR